MGDFVNTVMSTSSINYIDSPVFTLIENGKRGPKMHSRTNWLPCKWGWDYDARRLCRQHPCQLCCPVQKVSWDETDVVLLEPSRIISFCSNPRVHTTVQSRVRCYTVQAGSANCISIPSDENDVMIPDALRSAITKSLTQGQMPFCVASWRRPGGRSSWTYYAYYIIFYYILYTYYTHGLIIMYFLW
jgi:hypothetical protein